MLSVKIETVMKIGIFDSGIGGQAFLKPVQKAFPAAEVIIVDDKAHVPYGLKSDEEIRALTDSAIQPLLDCDAIVIACNTATAVAIEYLREKYPDVKFVGLEPMLKPASGSTRTGVIGVCATPATLKSERYAHLKRRFTNDVTVLEPDCSDWAELIENNSLNRENIVNDLKIITDSNCDVLALACTHYHWIREVIDEVTGEAITIIDPTKAVIAQLRRMLSPLA